MHYLVYKIMVNLIMGSCLYTATSNLVTIDKEIIAGITDLKFEEIDLNAKEPLLNDEESDSYASLCPACQMRLVCSPGRLFQIKTPLGLLYRLNLNSPTV